MAGADKPLPTRVLHAGPPAGGGKPLDVTMGVVGLLLLIAAVGLIALLPQDKVPPVQYSVTVVDVVEEADSSTVVHLGEAPGESPDHEFVIPVAFDNVYSFAFSFDAMEGDEPETEPDEFVITAFDLAGNQAGGPWILTTLPSLRENPPVNGLGVTFVAVNTHLDASIAYRPRPEDVIVDPVFKGETADQVRERLLTQWRLPTQGDWTVKVHLNLTGDCAVPDPTRTDVDRATLCAIRHPAAEASEADTGNEFSLSFFKYTYFDLVVTKLE